MHVKKHTANCDIDMGDIIDDNIYSLSFGRQHRGLKELEVDKVGFDEGNDEGIFWVLPGEYDGQQCFSCSSKDSSTDTMTKTRQKERQRTQCFLHNTFQS